jgi:CubicO group peptidase (beta-lactamase class C family)
MRALELVAGWPVSNAAAVVIGADGSVLGSVGDTGRAFRLASLTKMLTAWATLVAVEEGVLTLDDPVGQPGCTLRHLLAHAGGYAFDGPDPIAPPARRRIYSNTGIELAADAVAQAADMPFADYLRDAVLAPLVMTSSELTGSPAHSLRSCADDVGRFLAEVQRPTLISATTADAAVHPQYPDLAGIVPGVGRFDPCPWGLGFEIRGDKSPHWTGPTNSVATHGHFGGAGTMAWIDPAVGAGLVALTDRSFDDWAVDAMRCWPALSDAVVEELGPAR